MAGLTDRQLAELAALTAQRRPLRGYWTETPAGLRPHPGPVRKGTTVWVHGTGQWRPGIVERITRRLDRVTYTVAHSSPTNPARVYRKRVPIEELRVEDR